MYRKTAESKIVGRKTGGGRNEGFTLVEVMLTVAVLVVLMGLGMVGVVKYQKSLKMIELDNAAREIYMAAQNRAVLLKSAGRLDGLLAEAVAVSAGPNGEYYVSSANAAHADALNELLPWGSVDPALREGDFCILYKPASGFVIDVFYVETGGSLPDAGGIGEARVPDRNARMGAMLGWYGSSVPDEDEEEIPLPAPGIEVSIENGNELILTVKYTLPSDLPTDSFGRFAGVCAPKVTLDYQGTPVDLQRVDSMGGLISVDGGRLTKTGDIASSKPGDVVIYRWLLDSVRCKKTNADGTVEMVGQQFKGLFAGTSADIFGRDFTATAELTLSADGYISSCQTAQDTDNSLYDSTSTDAPETVACIANLRHLQNLSNDYSGSGGKSVARQIADIDASKVKDNAGNVINGDYEFQPIQNSHLYKYEADYPAGTTDVPYTISNLKVVPGVSGGNQGRGLFYTVTGWSGHHFEFVNVRLVDSAITGSEHSGGLTAAAPFATFTNCSVENVTVTSTSTGWGHAGGLAGYWWGEVEFNGCKTKNLTATSKASRAGGLIASANGSGDTIVIQNCVIGGSESTETITGAGQSGGLVGFMLGGSIKDCRVINTKVGLDSGGTSMAGGLVGQAGDPGTRTEGEKVTISGCQVYWTDMSKLGTSSNLQYQVKAWNSAGGLVGQISIDGTVDLSFAATLVYGGAYAGGLAGSLPGGLAYTLKVTKSYADCYIYGAMAGGMVGVKEGGVPRIELENSYTTGYLSTPAGNYSAGLCGGWSGGNINLKNVYAAIFYTDAKPYWDLAEKYDGTGYYLKYDGSWKDALYELISRIASWIMDTGGDFRYKGAADCHPYNLDGKSRTSYQLLGLKNLPHYGDWPFFSFGE